MGAQPCRVAGDGSSNMGSVEVLTSQWRDLNRATSAFRYQLFQEGKQCFGIPCLPSLAKGERAHSASVEMEWLLEGWWGGGVGRFLRRTPGPDVIPSSPSPDDLLLSLWFVPMTAMSSASRDYLLQSDVINGAYLIRLFCGCWPYDGGKYSPVVYLLTFCM